MKRRNTKPFLWGILVSVSLILLLTAPGLFSTDAWSIGTAHDNSRPKLIYPATAEVDPNIALVGNAALAAFCDLGNGSTENPYIIENYILNGTLDHGIELSGTNASVTIRNCTVMNGTSGFSGIYLWKCANVNITNNTFTKMGYGISLWQSNLTSVTENNCSSNAYGGVFLLGSENNTVARNECASNGKGIRLRFSHLNGLDENNCSFNGIGIDLSESDANDLTGNIITYAGNYGIRLDSASDNNSVSANLLAACGIGTFGPSNTIDPSNEVNGKSARYYSGLSGLTPSGTEDVGQLILIGCADAQITNLEITNTSVAIFMMDCTNISLSGNLCGANRLDGIAGENITGCSITNNNCSANGGSGISLIQSDGNEISDNLCALNGARGINVWQSDSNVFSGNLCPNNGQYGIYLWTSDDNMISGNLCNANGIYGIYLLYANANTVTENICLSNGEAGIQLEFSEGNSLQRNKTFRLWVLCIVSLIGINIVGLFFAGNKMLKEASSK